MCDATGLLPKTDVEFVYDGKVVYLVPAARRGLRTVVTLRAHGSHTAMSTDEIIALTRC